MKRRDFLKLTGVSLSAAGIQTALPFAESSPRGRVLAYAPVYAASNPDSEILTHYLPDSVHPILSYAEDWVRVPEGYLLAEQIQPMLPLQKKQALHTFPAYVEVSAPYAAVRAWSAATAPLVTRLGHGAVIEVEASLRDTHGQKWLKFGQIGWLQAEFVQIPKSFPLQQELHAVLDGFLLGLFEGEKQVATFKVNRPAQLPTGQLAIQSASPMQHFGNHYGVPWNLEIRENLYLHGVYWHHQYGKSSPQNIELPLLPAKWLYTIYAKGGYLTIR